MLMYYLEDIESGVVKKGTSCKNNACTVVCCGIDVYMHFTNGDDVQGSNVW